jgi:hypothetical protein
MICVTPLTGNGTAADPVRPKYAPWPLPVQASFTAKAPTPGPLKQASIIAFSYVPSDDGRFAIVEFVARARSAFQSILNDPTIQTFEKGSVSNTVIETALRKQQNLAQYFVYDHSWNPLGGCTDPN